MKVSSLDAQRIEAYLSGQLTKKASTVLEQEVLKREDFRAELSWQLAVKAALWHEGRKEESFRLQRQFAADRHLPWRSMLAYAAGILLILGLAWLFQTSPEPSSPGTCYYERPLAPEGLEVCSHPVTEAHIHFNRGDYGEAIQRYQNLIDSLPPEAVSELRLYRGLAFYELSMPEEALAEWALAHQHQDLAEWYCALALLELDRQSEAVGILQHVASTQGHHFQARAQQLLEELMQQ